MYKPILCAALLLMTSGCSTMNNTQAGAVGGGVFGGILGTMVGIATGHPLEGAAIGAGIGAGTGALVGHSEDRAERRYSKAVENAIRNPRVPIDEVVRMSQNRQISDDVIVNHIAGSGSIYQLSAADIEFMKQQGVSDRVVMFMQSRRPDVVHVGAPPPVVIVEPAPPPPVIGVGFGFGPHYHRRW